MIRVRNARSRSLVLVSGVAFACGGKVIETTRDPEVPSECESTLVSREGGGPRCDSGSQQCAQASENPRERYQFIFSFFDANPDARTLDCFVRYLRNRGANANAMDWNNIPGISPGTYVV